MRRWLGIASLIIAALVAWSVWPRQERASVQPAANGESASPEGQQDAEEEEEPGVTAAVSGRVVGTNGEGIEGVAIHLTRARNLELQDAIREGCDCAGCKHEHLLQACAGFEHSLARAISQVSSREVPSEQTVISGRDGRFELAAVPNAMWWLWAAPDELAPTAIRIHMQGAPLRLEVLLVAPGSMSGLVLDRESAEPIAGATVSAIDATLGLTHSAVTDRTGAFEIEGIGQLPQVIQAEAVGHAAKALYSPDLPVTILLEGAGRIAGVVTNAGQPAPGASIDLDGIVETESDGQGRFEFSGVAEGEHDVNAESEGLAGSVAVHVRSGLTEAVEIELERLCVITVNVVDERGAPLEDVSLGDVFTDESGDADLEFLGAGPYSFEVVDDNVSGGGSVDECVEHLRVVAHPKPGLSGVVLDRERRPIARAKISVQLAERSASPIYLARSREDGTFHLGLEPERYQLTVTKKGFLNGVQRFEKKKDQEVELEVVLEEALSIPGRVVDANDRALPGWTVTVTPDFTEVVFGDRLQPKPVVSDEDGRFTIRGVDASSYSISATGRVPWDQDVHRIDSVEAKASGGEVTLRLPAQASAEGRVTFEGAPAPATFVVYAPGGEGKTFDGAAGWYRLDAVNVGNIGIMARAKGFGYARGVGEFKAGKTTRVDLTLKPLLDLTVQVIAGDTQRAVENAVVRLQHPGRDFGEIGRSGLSSSTDRSGAVVFKDVAPGDYRLVVSKETYPTKQQRFSTLDPNAVVPNPLVFTLDRGLLVTGTFDAPEGCQREISLAYPFLAATQGTLSGRNFTVRAPAPGSFEVSAVCRRKRVMSTVSRLLEVPPGGLHDVAIEVPRGAGVLEVLHAPHTLRMLVSIRADRVLHFALTNGGETSSRFDLLAPGRYTLSLRGHGREGSREMELEIAQGSQTVDLR